MGMMVIMFILIGLERLKDILELGLYKRRSQKFYDEMNQHDKGSFERDFAAAQYRGSLNSVSKSTSDKLSR